MPEYIVVLANTRQELVDQVSARLKEGYFLQGGVSIAPGWLAQAMAK